MLCTDLCSLLFLLCRGVVAAHVPAAIFCHSTAHGRPLMHHLAASFSCAAAAEGSGLSLATVSFLYEGWLLTGDTRQHQVYPELAEAALHSCHARVVGKGQVRSTACALCLRQDRNFSTLSKLFRGPQRARLTECSPSLALAPLLACTHHRLLPIAAREHYMLDHAAAPPGAQPRCRRRHCRHNHGGALSLSALRP